MDMSDMWDINVKVGWRGLDDIGWIYLGISYDTILNRRKTF
jgi:hypothetical protein